MSLSTLASPSVTCPRCGGTGSTSAMGVTRVECLLCFGTGAVSVADAQDYSRGLFVPCTDCNGLGELNNANCDQCHGSGQITVETAESSRDCDDFIRRAEACFGFTILSAVAAVLQLFTKREPQRGGR